MESKSIIINIPIQSISSIITNSSSEVFAKIHSKDKLHAIYSIIDRLFGDQEDEITPVVNLRNKEDSWLDEETLKSYPDEWIEIELPYGMFDIQEFFKEGLEALLDKKIGNNNYFIIYED